MSNFVSRAADAETGPPTDPQTDPPADPPTGVVHVHYWASARSAAGCDGDDVAVSGPTTLAALLAEVLGRHPGTRLPEVLASCSVLVGDRPVATEDPADVVVEPGASVEFLPPFAGG